MSTVRVGAVTIGAGRPLVLIAGPCVLEGEDPTWRNAEAVVRAAADAGVPVIFKASFDKANRTSAAALRGPGLVAGLRLLRGVRERFGVPVTTDVHWPDQAEAVAEHVDLLQIPAFLCRQTDLLLACAATGRPINIKKGPFLAPGDLAHAIAKGRPGAVMVTERGTSFGHHDLVVDFRGFGEMAALGVPVCFDATHSVQRPGLGGDRSGGDRAFIPLLSRAAVAAGVDAVFAEVHEDPANAWSDAATQWPLAQLPALLATWVRVAAAVGR